ncbi:hypothetical protein L195_g043015 [Trifolium pratense]|uniref:Uncharacterized protein n=1 Tax=Trifolium pratense TaxID=57577 RepID=A0A2K3M801_TRIPR|nr:hypothetical protein L195_g043015 [Trifolium pratense]
MAENEALTYDSCFSRKLASGYTTIIPLDGQKSTLHYPVAKTGEATILDQLNAQLTRRPIKMGQNYACGKRSQKGHKRARTKGEEPITVLKCPYESTIQVLSVADPLHMGDPTRWSANMTAGTLPLQYKSRNRQAHHHHRNSTAT